MARRPASRPVTRGVTANAASAQAVADAAPVPPPEVDPMKSLLLRLKFSDEASEAIMKQGYDSLEVLADLTDDQVSQVCKIVRFPGGSVTTGQGETPSKDLGCSIMHLAETNLQLTAYMARHYLERISRSIAPQDVTPTMLKTFKAMKHSEDAYTAPDVAEYPTINDRSWPETFDNLDAFLRSYLGDNGIPLAYLTRERITVMSEDIDDPSVYEDHVQEMVARAPHIETRTLYPSGKVETTPHPTYVVNNKKLWKILAHICKDNQSAMVLMKPFQRKMSGRDAYKALFNGKLGTNAINDLVVQTESKLDTYKYTGETRKATFSKYLTFQRRQHNVLNDLKRFGYAGIDERTKVVKLLRNITSPVLQTVQSQILASPDLQQDYEAAASLMTSYLAMLKSTKPKETFQIAATQTKAKDDFQLRFYKKSEYDKLTAEQKKKLWEWRNANNMGGNNGNNNRKRKRSLTRRIAALEAALNDANDNDIDDNDDNHDTSNTGNRKNPALTRGGVAK